ncbi:MAG TPA: exodeoxyribonuclease VII small subunit [Bacillota bacterium]|nr:exodeoxyribonuclease VII small subunit [Bacillota bacterium]
MSTGKQNYQSLQAELDEVLASLQRPDIHVDEAVQLYEQGLKLVAELEKALKTAENKITQLKLQVGKG